MNLLLVLFCLVLAIYAVIASFIVYHLVKFGVGVGPKLVAGIFLAGSIVFIGLSVIYFMDVPWSDLINSSQQFNAF